MKKLVLPLMVAGLLYAPTALAQHNGGGQAEKSAAECYLECGPLHPWSPGDRMKCIDDCVNG